MIFTARTRRKSSIQASKYWSRFALRSRAMTASFSARNDSRVTGSLPSTPIEDDPAVGGGHRPAERPDLQGKRPLEQLPLDARLRDEIALGEERRLPHFALGPGGDALRLFAPAQLLEPQPALARANAPGTSLRQQIPLDVGACLLERRHGGRSLGQHLVHPVVVPLAQQFADLALGEGEQGFGDIGSGRGTGEGPLARHQIRRADRQAECRGDRLELAGGERVVELLDPVRDRRARRRRGVLAGDLRARLFEGRRAGFARLLDLDDVEPVLGSDQIADLPLAQGESRLLESGNHLPGGEPPEIAPGRTGGILRKLARQRREVGPGLGLAENELRPFADLLLLLGGGALGETKENVPRVHRTLRPELRGVLLVVTQQFRFARRRRRLKVLGENGRVRETSALRPGVLGRVGVENATRFLAAAPLRRRRVRAAAESPGRAAPFPCRGGTPRTPRPRRSARAPGPAP